MAEPTRFGGVAAAVLTPQNADLSPDIGALAAHCRWLLANGGDFLAVLGTTGEANSFSLDERIDILDGLAEAGLPTQKLLVGTGCCAIPDTVLLCRKALEIGAGGVLMLPPFYYKNPSDDGLFNAYSEVIERVASPDLRIYLYHFPAMSAVPLGLDLIERLIGRYPDTVVGIKDSGGDLANMTAMVERFPGFTVLAGGDQFLLPLLQAGGAGCITSVCNLVSALAAEVYANRSQADQDLLTKVRTAVTEAPAIPGMKEMLARHTGNAAWSNVRPPMVKFTAREGDALAQRITETGFVLPPA